MLQIKRIAPYEIRDRYALLFVIVIHLFIDIKEDEARYREYRRIIASLMLVVRNTTRKLFAHLHFLTTMAHANKMSADNLASVWAPTIMPAPLVSSRTCYKIIDYNVFFLITYRLDTQCKCLMSIFRFKK
jgi:hypothetical protein